MRQWKLLSLAAASLLVAAAPAPRRQAAVTVEIAIGKSIDGRVPVDTASAFPADVGALVCWTSVTGAAAGTTITHTWTHGPHSVDVTLNVGGSPWRTFSRRTIPADWTGEWKVEVKDASGAVLASKTFTVGG
jgi:plastocyanin